MANSKIVRLTAENVKRLVAVEIRPNPDGNLVIVGGRNAAGKSSVLDAIMFALAGKKALPAKPIREGKSAESKIEGYGFDFLRRLRLTSAEGCIK